MLNTHGFQGGAKLSFLEHLRQQIVLVVQYSSTGAMLFIWEIHFHTKLKWYLWQILADMPRVNFKVGILEKLFNGNYYNPQQSLFSPFILSPFQTKVDAVY